MGFVTVSEASPGIKYCRIRNQERRVERRQEEETVSAFIAGGTGVDAAMIIDGGERRFSSVSRSLQDLQVVLFGLRASSEPSPSSLQGYRSNPVGDSNATGNSVAECNKEFRKAFISISVYGFHR